VTADLAHIRPAQLRNPELLAIARRALDEADELPDIAALVDRAEVVRVAARKAKLSVDAMNDWAEFKLDAERKAGELLRSMDKNGGRSQSHDATARPPSYADLGVRKDQAHRWQQVASLPEPEYEAYKAETREQGDIISTAGAVARAKDSERQQLDQLAEQVDDGSIARARLLRDFHGGCRAFTRDLLPLDVAAIAAALTEEGDRYAAQSLLHQVRAWVDQLERALHPLTLVQGGKE
jgi:hypothetical protein